MLRRIYKSIRCLAFAMLLFAGATDMFSVDLDNDGDIDTDVILTADQTNLAIEGVSVAQEDISFGVALHLCQRTQAPMESTEPLLGPQNTPGPALSSPQFLVPLRT